MALPQASLAGLAFSRPGGHRDRRSSKPSEHLAFGVREHREAIHPDGLPTVLALRKRRAVSLSEQVSMPHAIRHFHLDIEA